MPPSSAPCPPVRRGFAVVDVETSGLDPTRHRVIEVAVTQLSPSGVVEREWSTLLRPRGGTGPVHVHGITGADLRGAPRFAEVAPTLRHLLEGRILVAHNAAFDWAFLAHEAARSRVALPVEERLCTVTLARQLGIPSRNLRLGTLADHWNIPVTQAHRAADDVRVLVEILRRCLDEAGRQRSPLPLEVCLPARRWWRLAGVQHRFRRRLRSAARRSRRRLHPQHRRAHDERPYYRND